MEQDQEESKCKSKVYKRSFPSGLAEKSAEEKVVDPFNIQTMDFFNGYVLRENPKKSCKFSAPVQETAVKCRLCGKEFKSKYSLNGHLRHHSGKERNWVHCSLCSKGFKSVMSLAGHMKIHSKKYISSTKSRDVLKPPNPFMAPLSDTETMNLVRRKRSKRKRYKFSPYPDVSSLNDSVCGLGIDQDEEEAVVSLLMLSRGGDKSGFFNSYDSLDSSLVSSENVSVSDDGYGGPHGDEPRKEWLDPFEGVTCDKGKMILMEVEVDDVSEFMLCNDEKEKGFHNETKRNLTRVDPREDLKEETLVDVVDLGLVKSVVPLENEMEKGCSRKMVNASPHSETEDRLSKKRKYTCKICNRSFPTYQSLGGHQTYHRNKKGSTSTKTENHFVDIKTNSAIEMEGTDQDIGEETGEVTLEHRCLICCKTFVSGQALGGHKRAHFVKATEVHIAPIENEGSDICNVVDANLPDLCDTEANCEAAASTRDLWWTGSSCEHEGLVRILAN